MANLLKQLRSMKRQRELLANLSFAQRNQILSALSKSLVQHKKQIIAANAKDLKVLKRPEMRSRLELNEQKVQTIAKSLLEVASLPEILNKILENRKQKNGLLIRKISVPLGTVGVIYESRPNVTVDLAALAFKSGNAIVLKGGSEAYHTNKLLVELIKQVLKASKLPSGLVYLIKPGEKWEKDLLGSNGLIEVIIPRGGASLIAWVRENSKIPVIETGAGVCHTFVDETGNINTAANIIENAKTQAPSVCNSLDTLVVQKKLLPSLMKRLEPALSQKGVVIYADLPSLKVLKKYYPPKLIRRATSHHYGREFLSLKLAVKTVNTFKEGLEFIKKYTSGHSEAIITDNKKHAAEFLNSIDAAVVYHNASTRFSDGAQFGLGAEVGISTQKLHARGPMGLEALTSYKWQVLGQGQARS